MVVVTDKIYVSRVEKEILAIDIDGIIWKTYHIILLTTYNRDVLKTDIKRK